MSYACPTCGGVELQVECGIFMDLLQDADGNIQTDIPRHGNHFEWDGNSWMDCGGCGYRGLAQRFEVADVAAPGPR